MSKVERRPRQNSIAPPLDDRHRQWDYIPKRSKSDRSQVPEDNSPGPWSPWTACVHLPGNKEKCTAWRARKLVDGNYEYDFHYGSTRSAEAVPYLSANSWDLPMRTGSLDVSDQRDSSSNYPVSQAQFSESNFNQAPSMKGHHLPVDDFDATALPYHEELEPPRPMPVGYVTPQNYPSATQRSQSVPARVTQLEPDLHISIFDANQGDRLSLALMDTGAGEGLWITRRLVEDLQLQNTIFQSSTGLKARLANDEVISSHGTVWLSWKVAKIGKRIFREVFNVFDSNSLDVVLGMGFLREHGIVAGFDITNLLPMGEAYVETPEEKLARKAAVLAQSQAAQASLDRKIRSEKKKAENKKGSSSKSYSSRSSHKYDR